MEKFELGTKIKGMNAMEYMADLIDRNESLQIEIERAKISNAVLKQMNNRSRILLDASKFDLKLKEFDLKKRELEFNMKMKGYA